MEGILLLIIMSVLFWKTDARNKPGLLFGVAAVWYGISRFTIENFREPDAHLGTMSWGLTMGQLLSLPMIAVGLGLLIWQARRG